MQPRYNSSGSAIVEGRPLDLDAAVRFIVSRMDGGMAVVNITSPEPWEREYELVSATDEPGWLMIRTPDDTPLSIWDQTVTRLVAHAKLGRFGDPEAERTLLRRLNGRLHETAGQ